ncbi:hypothetical protein [Erythrobacter alti]|uniref:hypothetical protein n=1 Tax=Erythrobacter alti TaxID=1896145 RepID=UPI0030F43014
MDAARDAWRSEQGAEQLMDELGQFGGGAPLCACPMLEQVFTETGDGERLMALLSRHYCAALADNPIGHPPFRHGFNGTAGTILLARSGRAQLMIQSREPGETSTSAYIFSDAERFDAVLAGEADARIVRARSAGDGGKKFETEQLSLRGGERIALDLQSETLLVDRVTRRLVVLRLVRSAAEPQPGRQYDAETGDMLMQTAATIATSRQEAIIALLGRMNRTDAAPEMARTALGEGDVSLRWQALRECLALDSEQGFCALSQLARRADDPLAASAGALRAQLLETHAELAQLETAQCPA